MVAKAPTSKTNSRTPYSTLTSVAVYTLSSGEPASPCTRWGWTPSSHAWFLTARSPTQCAHPPCSGCGRGASISATRNPLGAGVCAEQPQRSKNSPTTPPRSPWRTTSASCRALTPGSRVSLAPCGTAAILSTRRGNAGLVSTANPRVMGRREKRAARAREKGLFQ